jgi:hypothetical protein
MLLAGLTVISAPVVVANAVEVGAATVSGLGGAFILVMGAGLIGLRRRIRVSVSDTHLSASLTPIRVMHVRLAEVEDVEVSEVTVAQAGGLGWRMVGCNRFVLWSGGPAVWVTLAGGGRRVIRTDRAQELRDVILKAAPTAGS